MKRHAVVRFLDNSAKTLAESLRVDTSSDLLLVIVSATITSLILTVTSVPSGAGMFPMYAISANRRGLLLSASAKEVVLGMVSPSAAKFNLVVLPTEPKVVSPANLSPT